MEEIITNLKRGQHASIGGVKDCKKLHRPLQSSEPYRDAYLYWKCIACECERTYTDAALLGMRMRGCTELERCHC